MRGAAIALTLLLSAGSVLAQPMRPYEDARFGTATLVPAGWTRAPDDPRWHGTRFVAPDGRSWIAVYGAKRRGGVESHISTIARQAGEEMTYFRRGRGWAVASGYKGNRIFYRKALLGCGGAVWHHIAMEYPAAQKRQFDAAVTRASHSLRPGMRENCAE
jgi:hypothetical protein